jgi:hypothetical protein
VNPPGGIADWRDAEAYAPLLDVERSAFAWEWLRRDKRYRRSIEDALQRSRVPERPASAEGVEPAHWFLHAFEDPMVGAPEARPLWRSEAHDLVLKVVAEPCEPGDEAFLFHRVAEAATIVRGSAGEHLLLSDGRRNVRLDILRGSVLAGPVRLRYQLSGMRTVDAHLLVLRRLLSFWRSGRFSRLLHPPEARASRLVLMLRVYDAMQAGATQREIAASLLDRDAGEERWRVKTPGLRSRVQRLVRAARAAAAGGYTAFLKERASPAGQDEARHSGARL